MESGKLFAGIDVGASTTKAVIIDSQGQVLGSSVTYSGANFKTAAGKAFEDARVQAGGVSIPDLPGAWMASPFSASMYRRTQSRPCSPTEMDR